MSAHKIYRSIVKAIKEKKLKEPFTEKDFRKACYGHSESTYRSFLYNHTSDNRFGHSKLFQRINPGEFKLIKPIKYNL